MFNSLHLPQDSGFSIIRPDNMMLKALKTYFGPSTLVTAAFIGPGTITVCTIAGVDHGYSLLWAVLFSAFTTLILQEMSARLSLVTGKDLGEIIRTHLKHPVIRFGISSIVVAAIVIGNAAYEGGNIAGSALGFSEFVIDIKATVNGVNVNITAFICSVLVITLLFIGRIVLIEYILTALVVLMSVLFLITSILIAPDLTGIIKGLLIPDLSQADPMMVIALVGTTVVPYNLFLHASVIRRKYHSVDQLEALRKENAVAVLLGGFISMCIVVTSAAAGSEPGSVSSLADMSVQLEPVLGLNAAKFLGLGLFAAGISSSVTAPLAAAFTVKGLFGNPAEEKQGRFRAVWLIVVLSGTAVAVFSLQPILVIRFAQITNGILLPVSAILLLYLINQEELIGECKNSVIRNVLSVIVIGICILIGIRSLNQVLQWI